MAETKKAKKNPGIAQLTITLFIITAVVALLLGLINNVTAGEIERLTAEKTKAAMNEVLEADSYEEMSVELPELITGISEALDGAGSVIGHVVEVEPAGFGGVIGMVVGIDSDNVVTGVAIVSHEETSGLGADAVKPAFRDQYRGKSGTLAVDKEGGEINALTGATVTSKAVTDGVNTALRAVEELG